MEKDNEQNTKCWFLKLMCIHDIYNPEGSNMIEYKQSSWPSGFVGPYRVNFPYHWNNPIQQIFIEF